MESVTSLTSFAKYSGSGNEFLIVDNRSRNFPDQDRNRISSLCCRDSGIGADGILLFEDSEIADFKMRILNRDGSEAEMCGNGIRCLAHYLFSKKLTSSSCRIESLSGIYSLHVEGDLVSLDAPPPHSVKWGLSLSFSTRSYKAHFLNTGVPHLVFFPEPDSPPFETLAPLMRHDPIFAFEGTNVNFAQWKDNHTLTIRTFERGVEGETLACGTGALAVAYVAFHYNQYRQSLFKKATIETANSPICIIPASKEPLWISFNWENEKLVSMTQKGVVNFIRLLTGCN